MQDLLTGLMLNLLQQQQNAAPTAYNATPPGSSAPLFSPAAEQEQEVPCEQQQEVPCDGQDSSRRAARARRAAAEAALHQYEQFPLTAGAVGTVPKLLHLFEQGWPVGAAPLTYQPLSQSRYTGTSKAQRTQWYNMSQCYILLQRLAEMHTITTQQAAQVVEAWRLGSAAAYVLPAGTVSKEALDAQQPGSLCIDSLLSNKGKGTALGLDAVNKEAARLELVQRTKNQKRAAAGRQGGLASAQAKRQRKDGGT